MGYNFAGRSEKRVGLESPNPNQRTIAEDKREVAFVESCSLSSRIPCQKFGIPPKRSFPY